MPSTRREMMKGVVVTAVAATTTGATSDTRIVTPEQFGAKGDGRTNDTAAFAAMTAVVNRRGGGAVHLRKTTYVVGQQKSAPDKVYAFAPESIMEFEGCSAPLTIRGNGARLRCADGLRYGTFDQSSRQPTKHPQPFYGTGETSTPYFSMLEAKNCSGAVTISDLELDGNLPGLQVGGPFGDTGWQIPCTGLRLTDNIGPELLERVRSHHHGLDGLMVSGIEVRAASSRIQEVICDSNGRQGCSLVGGRRYRFVDCQFTNTGKAGLYSAPGAGVDIEAEHAPIRHVWFEHCLFSSNSGAGMDADQGDIEDAVFNKCRFIGTTSWAAWPRKPRFRFVDCEFIGAVVNAFGDADPERATQFSNCVFRDDPALSPTGKVYLAEDTLAIAVLPFCRNTRFTRCRFELAHGGVLPWSTNEVIYADCVMSQTSAKTGYPRGTFVGRNRIDGNVDLHNSRVLGELILNGRVVPRTG